MRDWEPAIARGVTGVLVETRAQATSRSIPSKRMFAMIWLYISVCRLQCIAPVWMDVLKHVVMCNRLVVRCKDGRRLVRRRQPNRERNVASDQPCRG